MSYYLQGLGMQSIDEQLNATYGTASNPTPATSPIKITTTETFDPDWKGSKTTIFDPAMFQKSPVLFNTGFAFPPKPSIDDAPLPPPDDGIPTWMIAAGVGALVLAIAAGVIVMKKKKES